MTAQSYERLIYQGQEHGMCCEPLAQYLALLGQKPGFQVQSSGCWRGYIGQWKITGDRLYLTDITGRLKNGEVVTLEALFPNHSNRVFAEWFSGTLEIPIDEPLDYVFGDIAVYEHDWLLIFNHGRLEKSSLRRNLLSG